MENWSTHQLFSQAVSALGDKAATDLRSYAERLIKNGVFVVFSLGHLGKITGVEYDVLRSSAKREREVANYRMFAIRKRSGGRRFIHSVCCDLFRVQQFLNQEILQKCTPHPDSFAFHPEGGIKKCAMRHCGAKWLFQFDLKDFFYHITETDTYRIFAGLGYRPLLAFEFARLCTTTHLPKSKKNLLGASQGRIIAPFTAHSFIAPDKHPPYSHRPGFMGVLPQGAPTSPMLSNLAARDLDEALSALAAENGFVYSRYADDITISAVQIPSVSTIGRLQYEVIARIRRSGFKENSKKTRVAGPGSRKLVLGLLVDGSEPRLSRETYHRIDRHLHAAKKFGLEETARHEGFDSAYGFFNHLSGLVAFVKDVDSRRWEEFSEQLRAIDSPWDGSPDL